MDAVKFLREFSRMCRKYYSCVGCPMTEEPFCDCAKLSQEDQERAVEIVENWSRENPEEIGKKYIIEIDRIEHTAVDSDYSHKIYHIKNGNGFWISEEYIAKLEEYKESDEQ